MFKKTTFFAFPFVIGALALMSRSAAAEECESAKACAAKRSAPCIVTCTLRGKVVKESTKEIELLVESTREIVHGVPMLSNLPYVNRCFQNSGTTKEEFVVRIPKQDIHMIVSADSVSNAPPAGAHLLLSRSVDGAKSLACLPEGCKALAGHKPCDNSESGVVAVQFPKTLSGPVATTIAGLPSTETEATSCKSANSKCELEKSNDNYSVNGNGQITLVSAEAKCDGSCSGGSGSTCKSDDLLTCCKESQGKSGACESTEKATCKCGAQCLCGNNQQSVINGSAYQEQLARLVRQSAELKAHTQAQRELAKHRAEFAKQLLDARTEIAHLHARLEFAERKEELMEQLALAKMENMKLQVSLKMQQREQEFFSHVQEQRESTSNVDVVLREVMSENAALEDRIAMLEKSLVILRTRLARVPGDGAAQ